MGLIVTPHAAVIIWNFDDRISTPGLSGEADKMSEIIISTISLISISTNKTKSDPIGTFQFTLAPTRNWVSVLTPGSWCAILMSNEPFDEKSFKRAHSKQVKMLGRIDAVRVEVSVTDDGARHTSYNVSGRDWGSIFNNTIYVDPIVADPDDPNTMANALYQQFRDNVFDKDNNLLKLAVPINLQTILSIIGTPFKGLDTGRLAKATHEVSLPSEVTNYFKFTDADEKTLNSTKFSDLLTLVWGPLTTDEDVYDDSDPEQTGRGWIDTGTLTGQHTLWAILQDNSNPALNEMFPEMYWPPGDKGPSFLLYNRIKPFSYTKDPASPSKIDTSMRSMFQLVASHELHAEGIISVHAGTNWADKFNFIEIKPDIPETMLPGVIYKGHCQAYQGSNATSDIFNREGFRPIMFAIRQLPFSTESIKDPLEKDTLSKWVNLAKEWYFDTHKLLNGAVVLQGSSTYIPVGDNIMFDAGLIGATANYNNGSVKKDSIFVLAHVESVQNHFSINVDGVRSFQTTIQFVRGIFVDEHKNLIGEGSLDTLASSLSKTDSRNGRTISLAAQNAPEEE